MMNLYERMYANTFPKESCHHLAVEEDSVNLHAMTHEDTEILGHFCDSFGIHGELLKKILLLGYLSYNTGLAKGEIR